MRSNRLSVLLIVVAVLGLGVLPLRAQDDVPLVPLDDPLMEVQGVVPEGWSALGNGLYARQQSAADPVLLAVQSALAQRAQVEASLAPQLGLEALPAPVEEVQTEALTWSVYQVDVPVPGQGTLRVDLALAQADGRVYIILLQAPEADYDALHEAVFHPVLQAAGPRTAATAEPTPYSAEDVTFAGGAEEITLAGTLTLPEGAGPFPAVVLVTGSGPQDRDESLAPLTTLKPFALIADALTRAGVAVLRYDDRGVAQSTGDFASATVEDFTADAAAAIDYLLTREEIDAEQIGLLGHSEGGIVAAVLGAENENLAFIIGMAPPAVLGVDLLVAQNVDILRVQPGNESTTEEEWATYEDYIRRTLEAVAAGDLETAEALIRETFAWAYDNSTPEELAQAGVTVDRETFIQQAVDAQLPVFSTAWYQGLLNIDTGAYWRQVTIPTLGIFGGLDVQVPAEQNAAAMEAALTEAGNEDFTIITLPDANHLFQPAETGGVQEYGTLPAEFTADFLPTIVDWVTARVGVVE